MKNIKYRVGVDIGGTFTDIVIYGDDASVYTKKISSTPDDYGIAIATGLSDLINDLNIDPSLIELVVHGTTVATNTIIEEKGAKTALITTLGFRDILEFRRIRIPELYNIFHKKIPPLVPRRLRFEVEERIGPNGQVKTALADSNIYNVLERIKKFDVQSLAICLLHSYANPTHEQRIAEISKPVLPEDTFITCSSEVLPEIREYERTSTTVINAYIGPIISEYLKSLVSKLISIGVKAPLHIMQSNGGILKSETVIKKPATIVESGPAAGVIGAAFIANFSTHKNLITLDMGGTTAKASIVEDGQITKTTEFEVGAGINLSSQLVKGGGHALKLSVVDVSEIGAGGGSIVSVDKNKRITVGPKSSGAFPGPACYDNGGSEPTLTDAFVILGYINPNHLVSGEMKLNAKKSHTIMKSKVGDFLEKNLFDVSHGVTILASSTMMRAVKAVTTYRGRDPRDYALFSFGGSGPILAAEVARQLQINTLIIPPKPGLFSAFGLLFSNIEHEFVQSFYCHIDDINEKDLERSFIKLEKRAISMLLNEGIIREQISIYRQADLRYSGQAFELIIPVNSKDHIKTIKEKFNFEHEKTYGFQTDEDQIDIVNIRVIGNVDNPIQVNLEKTKSFELSNTKKKSKVLMRKAYFGDNKKFIDTPIISRKDIYKKPLHGPLIIEEYDSTVVVPPGWEAGIDRFENIIMKFIK